MVTLGALLYLPVIVNICILSFAVRFEGSHVTAPLMVPANQYIFFRNYDRVKFILPFKKFTPDPLLPKPGKYNNKFATLFFAGVFATVAIVILYFIYGHKVMPRNSFRDCETQFKGSVNEAAGRQLCECIHTQGRYLNECPEEFEKLKNSSS